MTAAVLERPITPEELLLMEDGFRYELVDGLLVERNVSIDSSAIASKVNGKFAVFLDANPIGETYDADLGMKLFPNRPNHMRKADVSYIAFERAPRFEQGYLMVAPDLVVEVVSPGDRVNEVLNKAQEWLAGGVLVVWVVFPVNETIQVFRAGARTILFTAEDEITGDDVMPGFKARVASFFATARRRAAAATQAPGQ